MQTRLQRWGNRLAVRIPKNIIQEAHWTENAVVKLTLEDGRVVMQAQAAPTGTLEVLLAGVTKHNRHTTIETNSTVGQETW